VTTTSSQLKAGTGPKERAGFDNIKKHQTLIETTRGREALVGPSRARALLDVPRGNAADVAGNIASLPWAGSPSPRSFAARLLLLVRELLLSCC
jgi:hypothetical protein